MNNYEVWLLPIEIKANSTKEAEQQVQQIFNNATAAVFRPIDRTILGSIKVDFAIKVKI